MEFVVPHLSTASSSVIVKPLKKSLVLGAETSAISEEYFTLLRGTKLTDQAGGRKVIDYPLLGPKASIAKGIVTVQIQLGSVQLEVEILNRRIFENIGDLIGFMSLRELEAKGINLALLDSRKLKLLAGEENISEVRILKNQPQVPAYQVTVQQKYGNAVDVLSHRSNCLYKDMIMKPLTCGCCTGRYPSIWCPVFEKEAEQRSYTTLLLKLRIVKR
jgi:hypothetical protein